MTVTQPQPTSEAIALEKITAIAADSNYSDDLKKALIDAIVRQSGENATRVNERKSWWITPLAIALTGLITLGGNFAFDYFRTDQVQDFNTVQATLDRQAARDLQKEEAEASAKLRQQELAAQIGQERLKFQFEVIESELAKFTEATDRANSLNFLIRMGVLGDKLDLDEINKIIEEAKTNPDALPPVGNTQPQAGYSYSSCLDKSIVVKVDGALLLELTRSSPESRRLTAERAEIFARAIHRALDGIGACTPPTVAIFLANILYETLNLYYLEEPGDGGRYEGRRDLGNTEVGDGNLFKGRGMLMITGRANYARFAASIGRPDIMSNPALVATDPDIAALVASDYFRRRDLFRFCTATDCDVRSIRRGVNGGLNGLEAVLESYVQVKARLSE